MISRTAKNNFSNIKINSRSDMSCDKRGLIPRKGQALVEFSLILPLLIILCLSFIDVAFFLFSRVSVDRSLFLAINEACCKGPDVNAQSLLPLVRKRLVGVAIKESDLSVKIKPTKYNNVSELVVSVTFSRKAISLMLFREKAALKQTVTLSRLVPSKVVIP